MLNFKILNALFLITFFGFSKADNSSSYQRYETCIRNYIDYIKSDIDLTEQDRFLLAIAQDRKCADQYLGFLERRNYDLENTW